MLLISLSQPSAASQRFVSLHCRARASVIHFMRLCNRRHGAFVVKPLHARFYDCLDGLTRLDDARRARARARARGSLEKGKQTTTFWRIEGDHRSASQPARVHEFMVVHKMSVCGFLCFLFAVVDWRRRRRMRGVRSSTYCTHTHVPAHERYSMCVMGGVGGGGSYRNPGAKSMSASYFTRVFVNCVFFSVLHSWHRIRGSIWKHG